MSEDIVSLNFILSDGLSFLAVTTTSSVHVYQREGRLTFEEKLSVKYEKEVPSPIEVVGRKLFFEAECSKWRDEKESWRSLDK
jgi:hypothetical protein